MKDEAEREISYEEFYDTVFEASPDKTGTNPGELGPPPKKLCGEMWYEGEMAVLYGETGTGKSVFATQIADSLARGKSFGPFEVEGGPRKVLYFDLKLDSRKWLMRYAEEPDENAKRKHHRFPKNFERVHIRTEMRLPKGHTGFTLPFARALRQFIKKKKPDVVIFDSLTRLKHSNDVTRDVLPVMRELMRLKKEMNISILVLAQSQQHQWTGALGMTDLRGMRSVCNAADSIFGIAAGKLPGDRYIKQLRSYVSERLYDESHVPVFRLEKPNFESFLGLTFRHYAREASARRSLRDLDRCPIMEEAKALRDKKYSLRAIAVMLNVSKTSVQRMLQQWTPCQEAAADVGPQAACLPVDAGTRAPCPPVDTDEYDADAPEPHLLGTHASRVPVDEDEDDGDDDRDSTGFFDDEDENRPVDGIDDGFEERQHSREIILEDKPEKHSFSANRAAEPQESTSAWLQEPDLSAWGADLTDPHSAFRTPHSNGFRTPPVPPELAHIATPLEHNYDFRGADIWTEKFDEQGKPKVWYKYNGKEYRRYTRDTTGGISGSAVKVKIDSS